MLYSFLKSDKPIHYLLTGIILALCTALLTLWKSYALVDAFLAFLIAAACLLVFQFVVGKNELIAHSAIGIWIFLWLLLASMAATIDTESLTALLLLLLALRRILSMRSGLQEISKIFDASFWIAISCFINPWYATMFIVVYVGIFLFARSQVRFWFIPFIAMVCVGFLSFTIGYVFEIPMYRPWENSWDLVDLGIVQKSSSAFIFYTILCLAIVFLFIYLVRVVDVNKRVPQFISVFITLLVLGALLMVVNHSAPLSAALLTIPALAIFLGRASYFMDHKVFRELLLWFPVFICLVNWLLFL